jgi:hypothetical protein
MPARRSALKGATDAAALAQQKVDFTAEGSPPPGRVAKAVPQRPAGARRGGVSPPARKGPAARTRYG